jgi:hypothetical protein
VGATSASSRRTENAALSGRASEVTLASHTTVGVVIATVATNNVTGIDLAVVVTVERVVGTSVGTSMGGLPASQVWSMKSVSVYLRMSWDVTYHWR